MIKNFIKNVLVGLVLTGIVGFSTTVYAEKFGKHELPAISEGQGRIIIYRTKSIFGAAMRPEIYIDGKSVGKSKRATVGYLELSPGMHVVSAGTILYSGDDGATDVEIVEGEDVYVRVSMGASAFAGKSNVAVTTLKQAKEKKIAKLKVVKYSLSE